MMVLNPDPKQRNSAVKILSISMAALLAGTACFSPVIAAETPQSTNNNSQSIPVTNETRCIETDQVARYKTENDELVRLFMKNGHQMLLRLKQQCPQLHFHRYISYTPVDGKLCAGSNQIKTRAGLTCRIGSIAPAPADVPNVPKNGS